MRLEACGTFIEKTVDPSNVTQVTFAHRFQLMSGDYDDFPAHSVQRDFCSLLNLETRVSSVCCRQQIPRSGF